MLTKTRVETASLLERGRHDCRRGGQVKPALSPATAEEWPFLGTFTLYYTFSFYF